MLNLVSVSQMKIIEAAADAKGYSYQKMMEAAGSGLADFIQNEFGLVEHRSIIGLVGSGNNGGDTLVALIKLVGFGWKTRAYLVKPRPEDPLIDDYISAGGEVLLSEKDNKYAVLDDWLHDSSIILDGVLGTGISLPLKPEAANTLGHIAGMRNLPTVVAVDCPSGIDCDSGEVAPGTIHADITVCMAAVKSGLFKLPAYEFVGRLEIVDIGLPAGIHQWDDIQVTIATPEDVGAILPDRPAMAHKGTFGTAIIVAGSINYTGAALLAAEAAYRIGAGLVRVAVPAPLHSILAGQLPEATWILLPHNMGVINESAVDVLRKNLEKHDSILLGPGWGVEDSTGIFLKRLLSGKQSFHQKGPIGFATPNQEARTDETKARLVGVVIDADGLKLLAKISDWAAQLPDQTILTPHPGEMAILCGKTIQGIQADRVEIAQKYAKEWNCILVLKGALTVIAEPKGSAVIIPIATPSLARAGTGDVLAGIITGLRAQGVPAFEAAWAGAWIHGQAGMVAELQIGHSASVLAGDVVGAIPDVLQQLS